MRGIKSLCILQKTFERLGGKILADDLKKIKAELDTYKKLNPEAVIFYRKKAMAERLLKISLDDLKNATEQKWYGEYLALLEIRLENPSLCFMARKYNEELLQWYNDNVNKDERELAVLGMIQLADPIELEIPFNQHLWPKKMIADVQAVLLNHYTDISYTDEAIATYYLARQNLWRHEKRKIRVVFLVQSRTTCDKVLPLYEAMKQREEFETILIVHPGEDYKIKDLSRAYFYDRYPDDKIYSFNVMDLRKLRPDYVFFTNPYERRRPFPSFRANDVVKFAKICMVTYGATLTYVFAERLFEDFPKFWPNVYFLFSSAEGVKDVATKKFQQDVATNYMHVEFLGYPSLKAFYKLEKEPAETKRILWAPRWLYNNIWGGSHFMEYKDKFSALREKYGDKVELSVRPHPNLFRELINRKLMTEKAVADYKDFLTKNNITRQVDVSDVEQSLRNIDIFITDYTSIMICMFLTGRPVIYCEFKNAVPFPEYKEMFAAMYVARNWKDVERYLDDLMAGNDPLFEKRQEVAKKIYDTHKDAADKIIERVIQDFNQSLR